MSDTKDHSPGPWKYEPGDDGSSFRCVRDSFGDLIIYGGRVGDLQCRVADGILIASAPDLLSGALAFTAYETAMADGDEVSAMLLYAEARKQLRAAILKATGSPR